MTRLVETFPDPVGAVSQVKGARSKKVKAVGATSLEMHKLPQNSRCQENAWWVADLGSLGTLFIFVVEDQRTIVTAWDIGKVPTNVAY